MTIYLGNHNKFIDKLLERIREFVARWLDIRTVFFKNKLYFYILATNVRKLKVPIYLTKDV